MSAPRACTHCGLAVARAPAEGECFCCSGCFVAHRLGRAAIEGQPDRLLARVVLSAFLAMGVMVFSLSLYGPFLGAAEGADSEAAAALTGVFRLAALALAAPIFGLLGLPLFDFVRHSRRWLSADALILAGAGAAFLVSAWNTFAGGGEVWFDTATAVLVLFSLGRWLDTRARERASAAMRRAAPARAASAVRLELAAGGVREALVRPEELAVGDRIRLRPGDAVPADGRILRGRSFVATAALTGEEQPKSLGPGDLLLAGSALVDGSLDVRVTAAPGQRLIDAMERLLAEAWSRRAHCVRLADRMAAATLPLALALAAVTFALRLGHGLEEALQTAAAVVLIACPCALGIATPLVFYAALGAAWRDGVLIRGGDVLERLARTRRVYFDKTGTLTSGELELVEVRPRPSSGLDRAEALRAAVALETSSEHPIARSLRAAWNGCGALPDVTRFRALPGLGVEGCVADERWRVRRPADPGTGEETLVELEREGRVVAELALVSLPRPEAPAVLAELRARGLELCVLTGDGPGPACALAHSLGIPVESRLSPLDKLERVRAGGAGTVFVGDGLNDGAALAAADVGVSVVGASSRALEAAEVNLLRGDLRALPATIDRARAAVRTARVNLAWAFGFNSIGLVLAASGRLTPVLAACAMVLSSLVVVWRSSRMLRSPVPAPDSLLVPEPEPAPEPDAPLVPVPVPEPLSGLGLGLGHSTTPAGS